MYVRNKKPDCSNLSFLRLSIRLFQKNFEDKLLSFLNCLYKCTGVDVRKSCTRWDVFVGQINSGHSHQDSMLEPFANCAVERV